MGGLPLAGIDKNRITHEGSRGSRFCFQIQVIAQYMNMYIYAYTYTCLYIFIYTHTNFFHCKLDIQSPMARSQQVR